MSIFADHALFAYHFVPLNCPRYNVGLTVIKMCLSF